jgi:hypothetical protein
VVRNNHLIFEVSKGNNYKKLEIMRYLHQLLNNEGLSTEMRYSNNSTPMMSMEVMVGEYEYQIWDRESGELTIVK